MDGLEKREVDSITDLPPVRYVAAEANLETMGYFDAGYKRRYPKQPKEAKHVVLGNDRRVRISANAAYGYPNTEDLDFYRGFQQICDQRVRYVARWKEGVKSAHPHLDVPIKFSTSELLRATGREHSGRDLRAAKEWLARQSGTLIEGSIYVAKHERVEDNFRGVLFAQSRTRGEQLPDSDSIAEMNCVWPAPWFLSNFYYHYLKPVDVGLHQRLGMPIAKALYPVLDQGWYATRGHVFQKLYSALAALLGFQRFKHLSRIKQQLDSSHHQLYQERFLEQWEYRKSAAGGDFVLSYYPGPKFFEDQRAREDRKRIAMKIPGDPTSAAERPAGEERQAA